MSEFIIINKKTKESKYDWYAIASKMEEQFPKEREYNADSIYDYYKNNLKKDYSIPVVINDDLPDLIDIESIPDDLL